MKTFRVALVTPDGMEVPEGYELMGLQPFLPKKYYASEWIEGIKPAQQKMIAAAQFYSDREVKYLYFREIRHPVKQDSE